MSFKEAVVNMFSKMEKFRYRLTLLAVGREKNRPIMFEKTAG